MQAYWRKLGTGPRRCLAFHCSLAHSGAWGAIGKILGEELSIQAMDNPAHGKSGGQAADPEQVERAVDWGCARLTEPMDVFGHSFGGYLALRVALRRPDLVRSLWLYESVFFAAVRDSDPELYAENASRHATMRAAMDAGDLEVAARLFMSKWGDGDNWDKRSIESRRYCTERIEHIREVNPWLARDVSGALAELPALTMPVQLVDGGASPVIVAKIQDSLAKRIPGAARVTLGGLSHMAPITNPKTCAKDIADFLSLR